MAHHNAFTETEDGYLRSGFEAGLTIEQTAARYFPEGKRSLSSLKSRRYVLGMRAQTRVGVTYSEPVDDETEARFEERMDRRNRRASAKLLAALVRELRA